MNINDNSIVVTGGASGLGEATARRLSKAGGKVTLFDLNEERGNKIAQSIHGLFARVDVSNEKSVVQGLDIAESTHGNISILVNCAGIAIGQKTASKGYPHSLDEFQKVMKVNLVGTFNCIRLAAMRMTKSEKLTTEERGVIVNTASVAAFDGQIGQAAYAASKGGIVSMTLPIARDLARDNIRVVTIAPGLFQTPLMDSLPEEIRQALASSVPYPARLGQPDEFAALVQHICENTYLNAETIRLDGAIRLAPR